MKDQTKDLFEPDLFDHTKPDQLPTESIFGPIISHYTRAQAIADGELVDISKAITPFPFKWPVALTRAAYHATIAAGGKWTPGDDIDGEAGECLKLPGGQDVTGRVHDLLHMLKAAINSNRGPADMVDFCVRVDTYGNGRCSTVQLYATCGPGDTPEPVITVCLKGED